MNKQTIYNPVYINFNSEKLFLGEGKNSQRYDVLKYPFFDTMADRMMGQDWTHDEVNCIKDKQDFVYLSDAMKHAYTGVLQKLIFLDSIQGRGLLQSFGSIITLPELEACITIWQHFEIDKHSKSYTHILRSVYDNPTAVFDSSFAIPELVSLTRSISEPYDECFNYVTEYNYKLIKGQEISAGFEQELRKALVRLFIEINILEGIRFYSGFATIWSMHYSQGLMERTGKVLQLICRDENLHLAITQYLLRLFRTVPEEGFREAWDFWQPHIADLYSDALDQESAWIDYLFGHGSFLGMTPDLARSYLRYLANKRLRAIGEPPLYPGEMQNPLEWVETYINNDLTENLPQESEILNYKMDILNQSITEAEISNLQHLLQ